MERTSLPPLLLKREVWRLWFEYYKLACASNDGKVKGRLKQSAQFYAPWGEVRGVEFKGWWKTNGYLFVERNVPRVLQAGEEKSSPDNLAIEIPLNQSPTKLAKAVRAIIDVAYRERDRGTRKSKTAPSTAYRLSAGSEPKLAAVREMLNVYRDVYLKNPNLRGEKLLVAAQSYYKGRKSKRWAKVPMSLETADGYKERAMRNLRRYIQKAEKIVFNVAGGEFPGRYD